MDWLLAPLDAARAHDVGAAVSWHGRAMVLAWGILAPLAVIFARFFKIMPGQDWPRQLDNQTWWMAHWMGQTLVLCLSVIGLTLVLPSDISTMTLHGWAGYAVLTALLVQVLLGLLRGSKGGPTAPAPDGSLRGHHYDMTPRRRMFEALHKSLGYLVLLLAACTILLGLFEANAPRWMWIVIPCWWAVLIALFHRLQSRGLAVDTYQAIWGDDPAHPGNRRPPPGWGVARPEAKATDKGGTDVRRDRGDRVRSN